MTTPPREDRLPLVPPPPPPGPETRAATRPSRDDLAAVDALLKSHPVEGPMAPFEKPGVGDERWTSSGFGGRPAGGAVARPSSRRVLLLAALGLAVAAAIAGGVWYNLRVRPSAPAQPPSSVVRRSPAPTVPTTLPPVTAAASTAHAPPATSMAAPATAAPPPPTMAPARVNEPVSLAQARILMRQGQLPQAARGFQTNVKAAPSGTLSVQLLVACAPETVQKAVDGVQSDELFILPVNYKGRDCFRMCWGLYSTQAKATSALRALPEYFRIGGATPKVAPVASLLP